MARSCGTSNPVSNHPCDDSLVDAEPTIRAATGEDLEAILAIADASRRTYATYQPQFWRPAEDAVARQRPYLDALLHDETAITLVAVNRHTLTGFAIGAVAPAPPVYDPGGPTCLLDDSAVADPADWSTTGAALLRAVRRIARQRGAAQIVVITGHMDDGERAMLAAAGLSIASEWWTGVLNTE